MNKILKLPRKKSWREDLLITIILASMTGLLLSRYLPEKIFDRLSSPAPSNRVGDAEIFGNIVGHATVIDGDTIKINGTHIRFYGIDAPEISQTCLKDNITYSCGLAARTYLQQLINNQTVICRTLDKDRYGRDVAKCFNYEKFDINGQMVSSGNAIAYLFFSRDYAWNQAEAKKKKLGIWAGQFTEPYYYRRMKKRSY